MLLLLPAFFAVFFNSFPAGVEANLSLGFKATKILREHNPANCTVGNTTYAHGQTFKLDCKTQCVCENGRHACSSLCPKEQLPAPEDTISCRSPRMVEVPGHCCKMWLCENPTADVYATCHNSSTSPWTPCSQNCGMGISTRFTSTTAGCNQLSNLRLCENRKCDLDNKNNLIALNKQLSSSSESKYVSRSQHKNIKDNYQIAAAQLLHEQEHRVRKGHECRSIQRLGPARIRLGSCVSRKLYRPKLCGRCHHTSKCCVPSVSTTIQVELLCPLNAGDPINFAEQQLQQQGNAAELWDTQSLEPIDQEYLQSHQMQIENKFIAIEWILKCECSKKNNCNNQLNNNNYNDKFKNDDYNQNSSNNNISNNSNSNNINNAKNRYDYSAASGEFQPDIIPYPESRQGNKNNKMVYHGGSRITAKQHQVQHEHEHEQKQKQEHGYETVYMHPTHKQQHIQQLQRT